MKHKQIYYACLLLLSNCFWCCTGNSGCTRTKNKGESIELQTPVNSPISVSIYVENSGSMAGYCNLSDKSAIETLIRDYYDRLNSCSDIDQISLNFINTTIENSKSDINNFTKSIKSKCTAKYTKLDEMLEMMKDSINNNRINLLISDYVFSSNNGNLAIASSAIASQFSQQLKDKDIAVAIFKYMVNFKGKYYPGGIMCNKPLPLYIWAFGNKENVRKITKLPFNSENCGTYFMQKASDVRFELMAKSKRMIKDGKIHVSEWKKDRHKDFYEFSFTTKLNDILLPENDILETSKYIVQSNNSTTYNIAKIEKDKYEEDKYKYTIRTNGSKPAPGELTISYPIITPEWVNASNFEGNGIPNDSTTYGVSYLINGVSKAFEDNSKKNNNYFTININFE